MCVCAQDSIFKDSMLACTSHSARAALTHVQEKHQECQRLESSITELAQLFQDLSLLVDAQGEILDDIEYLSTVCFRRCAAPRTAASRWRCAPRSLG